MSGARGFGGEDLSKYVGKRPNPGTPFKTPGAPPKQQSAATSEDTTRQAKQQQKVGRKGKATGKEY